MKWLDERPRPLHEAWNILCDAIAERIDAFQIEWEDDYQLPRLPSAPFEKRVFSDYVSMLRSRIITLIQYSFFPPWFGRWSDLQIDKLGIDRPDGEFYRELGIDGYAFFMRSGSDAPQYKYSLNNFIHAAAEVINKAVVYPLPGKENRERAGFLLDADLEVEVFDPVYHWSGKFSDSGQKTVYLDDIALMTYPYQPVFYLQKRGRTRARNLRWKYCKAGGTVKSVSPFYYRNPVLSGTCKLLMERTDFSYTDPESSAGYTIVALPAKEFVIDFETGEAREKVDLSGVQKKISEYWNLTDSTSLYNTIYRVILERAGVKIMLERENFPAINYKYLS